MPAPTTSLPLLLTTLLYITLANTQTTTAAVSCTSTLAPLHAQPSVAPGWHAQVVANGLRDPRGIVFDAEGGLLVVEQGRGIVRVEFDGGEGACVRGEEKREVVGDGELNHGIELSADGRTLYASTAQTVYAWDYDASQGRTTSEPREIIGQMGEEDGHVTRTLMMSRKAEGMLLVSRGSMSNLDPAALDVSTGVSTIKAFNISNITTTPYNFAEEGLLLGWGLRNSVGIAEDPATGAIYSVENSVDNFQRNGRRINQNNPGEELNFHGFLNGTQTSEQGGNYGYPSCYAAWGVDEIPDNEGLRPGMQFAIGEQNDTLNDAVCQRERVAPRLTFAAHMAPLDVKFNRNGSAAWVTFHGSWNREDPIGYKLSVIGFSNGEPTEPADSITAAIDIVSNADLSECPSNCFRPVGLAWDSKGRLFMSSDSTGEIYVVVRAEGGSTDEAGPPSNTGAAPSPSPTGGAEKLCANVGHFAAVLAGIMALPLV